MVPASALSPLAITGRWGSMGGGSSVGGSPPVMRRGRRSRAKAPPPPRATAVFCSLRAEGGIRPTSTAHRLPLPDGFEGYFST